MIHGRMIKAETKMPSGTVICWFWKTLLLKKYDYNMQILVVYFYKILNAVIWFISGIVIYD